MNANDYNEIEGLLRGAAHMLVEGQLNEWQHANTSTFHLLATAILDLNARLHTLELAGSNIGSNKPLLISPYGN